MKIITNYSDIESKSRCYMCNKTKFVVEDYNVNCPICNHIINYDNFTVDEIKIIENHISSQKLYEFEYENGFKFCSNCNIIFTWDDDNYHGTEQWEHGTTIYYGLLVEGFIYKGKYYDGMPVFDDKDEFIKLLKNNEFATDYFASQNDNDNVGSCSRSDVPKAKTYTSIPSYNSWGKY